jgi:pyruvate formate lyase activating enzyme
MENGGYNAKFYSIGNGYVRCELCPHLCVLKEGKRGRCGVRENAGGRLISLNYGRISSMALDPIEKKPLRRYMPGTNILSFGSYGCNLSCDFCQNYPIAQRIPETIEISPREAVDKALEHKAYGNIGIAYTYNEPSIWYEYVYDCAVLAKSKGLVNVLVTNGYINDEPLEELLPYISAMNIDLKGDDRFYRELCGAPQPASGAVRSTIKKVYGSCHVEVTVLIVPGWNDSVGFVESTVGFIASVSDEIPLHLSRFYPKHRMADVPPTDREFLFKAAEVAAHKLNYVYIGNIN